MHQGSTALRRFLQLAVTTALGAIVLAGCTSGPFASGKGTKPATTAIPPKGAPGGAPGSGGGSASRPDTPRPLQKTIRTQAFVCTSAARITLVFLNPPDQVRLERAGKPPALLNARHLNTAFRYSGSGYEVIARKDGGVDWTAPGQLVTACSPAPRTR